ncbi:MAG: hypothetical protein QN187_12120 [Armatimonadota bacterium]|nr:hypothetical protein [Armatimonadota bacterium]MDR7518607.1 hypothetical protein [Armatimonadota bacterium]MDR7548474.1 hypothetical protein [Armatimonadota bacterium]
MARWCGRGGWSLVGVHHDLDRLLGGPETRLDHLEVVPRIAVVEAEFDRPKALVPIPSDVVGPPLGRPHLRGAGVCLDPILVATPEAVEGQSGGFADDVPQRDLHQPGFGPEHLCGPGQVDVPFDGKGILPDEIGFDHVLDSLDHLAAAVGVGGAHAGDPRVGVDLQEGCQVPGLGAAGPPGGIHRLRERHEDEREAQIRDLHGTAARSKTTTFSATPS